MTLNFHDIAKLDIPVYANESASIHKCKEYFKDILFLDIGAYQGLWSLAALMEGAIYVVAFDREPIDLLARNLSEYAGRYRCVNLGVDSESKYLNTSIDDWVDYQEYNQVGFIKIDVEGEEFEVLKGAQKTISKFNPSMMIESHDYLYPGRKDEIIKLLGEPTDITSYPGKSHIHHIYYLREQEKKGLRLRQLGPDTPFHPIYEPYKDCFSPPLPSRIT